MLEKMKSEVGENAEGEPSTQVNPEFIIKTAEDKDADNQTNEDMERLFSRKTIEYATHTTQRYATLQRYTTALPDATRRYAVQRARMS